MRSTMPRSGVPVACFPVETYVNTNGIVFNRALQPGFRDIGWLDAPEIDSAKTRDRDSKMIVSLKEPPLGHVEDAAAAARRRVNRFYRCEGPLLGEPMSVWTLKFFPLKKEATVEEYVDERMKSFFLSFPTGTISTLTFHHSVISHLSSVGTSGGLLFRKKAQYVCGEDAGHAQFGQMSFFLRTHEGVWDLSWHAVASLLTRRKELFVGGLKLLTVSASDASTTLLPRTAVPLPTPDL